MTDLQPGSLAPASSAAPGTHGFPLLAARLDQRLARVAVAGLGAVGLPLLELLHGEGLRMLGIDPLKSRRDTCLVG